MTRLLQAAKRFSSLRLRLLIPILGGIALMIAITAIGDYWLGKNAMLKRFELRSEKVADAIIYASETVEDEGALHRFVSALAGQPEVKLIVVAGGSPPRIIASTRHDWRGKLLSELPYDHVVEDLLGAIETRRGKHNIHQSTREADFANVLSLGRFESVGDPNAIGAVMVHLDMAPFQSELNHQTIRYTLWAVTALLLFATGICWLISMRVLKPIRQIDKAIERYHETGDTSQFSIVENDDELGRLSTTLQHALDDAASSRSSAEHYAADLKFQKTALDEHAIVSESDAQGSIIYVNEKFTEISGYSEEELLGQDHRILNSGYHDKSFWEVMYASLARHGSWSGEICNQAKNGSMHWMDTTIVAYRNKQSCISRYVSIRTDITHLKDVQSRLRQSEERLALALESAKVGLWDWNPKTGELYINDIWASMLGYQKSDIASDISGCESLIHPEDAASVNRAIESHLKGLTRVYSAEFRMKSKKGEWIWIASTGKVCQRDESGNPIRMTGIHIDITDKIRMFEELEVARDAAETAAQAKSQFLATMSHEIRTPMNGLMGVLHLMEEGASEQQLDYLKTAEKSADDLLVLINDILDFSKIEAGKMVFENKLFDALEMVEDVCELHAPSAHAKGLELNCMADPVSDFKMIGDPHRLRQVVSNLVSNAVKFTSEGEINIILESKICENGEGYIDIQLQDTGIGISKVDQTLLFDSFTQANSSTTRKFGGTGLGLSICKRIVELMDGDIGVRSVESEGSTFWLWIPKKCKDKDHTIDDREAKPLADRSFLIVDRSQRARQSLSAWLESWGGQVFVAHSLEDAADHVTRIHFTFDHIFLDRATIGNGDWKTLLSKNAPEESLHALWLYHCDEEVDTEGGMDVVLRKPARVGRLRELLLGESSTRGSQALDMEIALDHSSETPSKVLLVDDNQANRKIASEILKRQGVLVDTANDGHQAIDAIKTAEYDLIFMDCMMPELDGYEASRAIRDGVAGEVGMGIPIIALTANAMAEDRERCIRSGMTDYLAKPIKVPELKRILGKWLNGKSSEIQSGGTLDAPVDKSDQDVFDLSVLRDLYEDEIEQIEEVLSLFKDCVEETASLLEDALDDHDENRIRFFAHRLKGSAGEYGACQLANIVGLMEEHCARGRCEEAISMREDVSLAIGRVRSYLENIDLRAN